MKKILIVFCLLFISATPAFCGMEKTMDRLMDSWVGENIDSVINLWGPPTEEKVIDNKKFYYWNKSQDIMSVGSGVYGGTYGGTLICNKNFEVNKNNMIVDWSWEGNACPSTYRDAKKFVNPLNNYWKNK